MTFPELLATLALTDHQWHLDVQCHECEFPALRAEADAGRVCPITAVYQQVTGRWVQTSFWRYAAEHLDLPLDLALDILRAADGNTKYLEETKKRHVYALRQDIVAVIFDTPFDV